MNIPQRSTKAFTLIELIVVIVILGLLALLAIPTFGKAIAKSQDSSTISTLQAIARDSQAIKAMDQASAWGTIPADAIGETNKAAGEGTLAAVMTAVADDGTKNPKAGEVAYFVKDDGVVVSMLSGAKRICVVGFNSISLGKSTCQDTVPGATTSVGSSLSSGPNSVLPSGTSSSGGGGTTTPTPAPTPVVTTYSTVFAWGDNSTRQTATASASSSLNNPTAASFGGPIQSAAVNQSAACAVMGDATVKCVGASPANGASTNTTTPTAVAGLNDVVSLATNDQAFYALLGDGTVKVWGDSYEGIGLGSTMTTSTPTLINGLTNVKSIVGGSISTYALLNDGSIMGWGSNESGELGNGTVVSSTVPVPVAGGLKAQSIGAGGAAGYAVLADGSVKTWGDNHFAQLGVGPLTYTPVTSPVSIPGLSNVAKVVAGQYTTFAVLKDGTLKAWGYNSDGQVGNGSTDRFAETPVTILSGVADAAGGYYAGYALMQDGTVKAWGDNYAGQLGIGSAASSVNVPTSTGLAGIKGIATQSRSNTGLAWK